MNNRQRLISILNSNAVPQNLKEELKHFMFVDRDEPDEGESPYDLADAFHDAMYFAEDNRDNTLDKICKAILITLGYYVPMSQKEIENTYVTRGTVWDFKLKGIPYKSISSFEDWLER